MKESSDQILQCCIYKLTGHGKLTNRSTGLNALYILANIFFPNELSGALSKKMEDKNFTTLYLKHQVPNLQA
jgi:hypothetical protein